MNRCLGALIVHLVSRNAKTSLDELKPIYWSHIQAILHLIHRLSLPIEDKILKETLPERLEYPKVEVRISLQQYHHRIVLSMK